MTPPPRFITALELRRNFPKVRKGLDAGTTYVLLYRGKPVAELRAASQQIRDGFFGASVPSSSATRIRKNVERRRKKRVLKKLNGK